MIHLEYNGNIMDIWWTYHGMVSWTISISWLLVHIYIYYVYIYVWSKKSVINIWMARHNPKQTPGNAKRSLEMAPVDPALAMGAQCRATQKAIDKVSMYDSCLSYFTIQIESSMMFMDWMKEDWQCRKLYCSYCSSCFFQRLVITNTDCAKGSAALQTRRLTCLSDLHRYLWRCNCPVQSP